jgi:hypothetical protein
MIFGALGSGVGEAVAKAGSEAIAKYPGGYWNFGPTCTIWTFSPKMVLA